MVAFLAALPAFIAALPAFLQLAVKMMALVEKIAASVEKNQLHKWLAEVETSIDDLDNAQTKEQKLAAAKKFADLIRGLG